MPYLDDLTHRLAVGLAQLPEAVRNQHANFLLAHQRPDGGFAGREGGSDLYYTGFALRGLAMLGRLYGEPAERAGKFLQSRFQGRESVVDFLSLIYGGMLLRMGGVDIFPSAETPWKQAVAETLLQLRRADGGFAKGTEGNASSTYYSFLVLLCLEQLGWELPQPEKLRAFVLAQAAPEGGFFEIRASKRAGTNPTAAAIATLRTLGGMEPAVSESTLDFLVEMQTEEGGLRANTRIPIADLLSSFTGLLTLEDLGGGNEINRRELARFVRSLEQEEGGFHGAAWDAACDVEYTFYGLGCRALLASSPEATHGRAAG